MVKKNNFFFFPNPVTDFLEGVDFDCDTDCFSEGKAERERGEKHTVYRVSTLKDAQCSSAR